MAITTKTAASVLRPPRLTSPIVSSISYSYRGSRTPLSPAPSGSCYYHSDEYDPPSGPFGPVESRILAASLKRVPEHGFTETALALGAKDTGYLDASINLFPRGTFDLVHYHLVTQRRALKDRALHEEAASSVRANAGIGRKVCRLTLDRLMANTAIIHRWQEALAIMAQPKHVRTSIAELAKLADEIWYLAGDTSTDTSWYSKRASLSTIYASTEFYMTQDRSPKFLETKQFLERRMNDVQN
ncbi:MAG: Ubiquinone biosynthesis protein coq9, mitochondrial, partial [Peltula sp. TS41687]